MVIGKDVLHIHYPKIEQRYAKEFVRGLSKVVVDSLALLAFVQSKCSSLETRNLQTVPVVGYVV